LSNTKTCKKFSLSILLDKFEILEEVMETKKHYEYFSLYDQKKNDIIYVSIHKVDTIIYNNDESLYYVSCENDKTYTTKQIKKLTKEEFINKVVH